MAARLFEFPEGIAMHWFFPKIKALKSSNMRHEPLVFKFLKLEAVKLSLNLQTVNILSGEYRDDIGIL